DAGARIGPGPEADRDAVEIAGSEIRSSEELAGAEDHLAPVDEALAQLGRAEELVAPKERKSAPGASRLDGDVDHRGVGRGRGGRAVPPAGTESEPPARVLGERGPSRSHDRAGEGGRTARPGGGPGTAARIR